MPDIKLDTLAMVVRVSDLQSTPVDGDLVILNLAMSSYIGLDNIGHRIWQMLETPIKIDELIRRLTTEYAGGPQEIARDLIDFLNELYSQNLIAVVQAANTHKAGIG